MRTIVMAFCIFSYVALAAPSKEAIEFNELGLLQRAGEPNLISLSTNAAPELRVARFTYVPAFGDTIIIRITQRGPHARARRLIFSRATIDEHDWPTEVLSSTISEKQANALLERVDRFFSEEKDSQIEERGGMDGETWALEYMSEGQFYWCAAWVPKWDSKERNTKEFVAICQRMTTLAGLSPRMDLENETRIRLCDPVHDDDFDVINLRPREPLWSKMRNWFN